MQLQRRDLPCFQSHSVILYVYMASSFGALCRVIRIALLNLCVRRLFALSVFVLFVRYFVQGGGGAAKKAKMADNASKIDWKDAVLKGEVRIFRCT